MPYIKTTTSVAVSDATKESLKNKLGEAIALIPGKTDRWLMLAFEDNISMAFAGKSDEQYAMAEVNLLGAATREAYERLTAAICEIYNEELGIKPENTYVMYSEFSNWGWNGSNF